MSIMIYIVQHIYIYMYVYKVHEKAFHCAIQCMYV